MSFSNTLSAAAAALILLLPSLTANAQQRDSTSQDSLRAYRLDEIVISASRFEKDPSTVGRNVTVITRSEIESSLHHSLGGLLAGTQSLHLVGTGQTPGSLQQGFLRSADSDQMVVMIDGVRISDPSTVNNGVDLSELSLARVERVEIVRGAHSTLYGSSAVGGVINVITRGGGEPGTRLEIDTRHGGFAGGSYLTDNTVYAGYSAPGGWYANLAANQKYSSGLDATVDTLGPAGGLKPDRDPFRKLDLSARVGYRGEGYHLWGAWRRAGQRLDVDQSAYNDDDNAFVEFQRTLLRYGGTLQLGPRFHLEADGAWSDIERDFVNDSSLVAPGGPYDGTYTETRGRGSLLDNELLAVYRGESLRFSGGLSSVRQTMNNRTYTFISSFNFESETDLDSLDLSETVNSVFLRGEVDGDLLGDPLEGASLAFGGRISHHDRFGTHFTWEVNPSLRLGDRGVLYAAAATGFNAPSLYQLYSPEKGFGAHTTRGNRGLGPERSLSLEAGWKQTILERLRVELSLYRREVSNVIEYVYLWEGDSPQTGLTGSDFRGDTYLNLSEQRVRGIELAVDARLSSRWQIKGNLSLNSSTIRFDPDRVEDGYTGGHHVQVFESGLFLDSARELSGLTRRPYLNAAGSVVWRPDPALRLAFATKYVGSRDDVSYRSSLGPFGAQDRTPLEPYQLSSMTARYRVSETFTVTGKIENLFNADYREINGYRTRGRGVMVELSYRM